MKVYLAAQADANYDACAFAYIVGNSDIISERKWGSTVVESYLNGFISLNRFIVANDVHLSVHEFIVCSASPLIAKIISTDYLEKLEKYNWKTEDGKFVFYVPILKELLLLKLFYAERDIYWSALSEVSETDYRQFELCVRAAKSLL